jgi:hypothetical protein
MVTPTAVTMMLQGQRPHPGRDTVAVKGQTAPSDTTTEMRYEALDRFVVKVTKTETPRETFTMVWLRTGFTWKLSAVRLPR